MKLTKLALIGLVSLTLGTTLNAFEAGLYECEMKGQPKDKITHRLYKSGKLTIIAWNWDNDQKRYWDQRADGYWKNKGKSATMHVDYGENTIEHDSTLYKTSKGILKKTVGFRIKTRCRKVR